MFKINNSERVNIPMDLIDMDERNKELFGDYDTEALSLEIEEDGFNGAIEVWELPNGRYEISSGHTRYLVAKQQGATEIPCLVAPLPSEPSKKISKLIMSNIHQKRISPLSWGKCLKVYDEEVLKQEKKDKMFPGKRLDELARRFGISRTSANRYMSLTKLIPEYAACCDKINAPYNVFVPLASLPEEQQRRLYDRLVKRAPDGDLLNLSMMDVQQCILMDNEREEAKLKKQIAAEEYRENYNRLREERLMEQNNYNKDEKLPEVKKVAVDDSGYDISKEDFSDFRSLDELGDINKDLIHSDFNSFDNTGASASKVIEELRVPNRVLDDDISAIVNELKNYTRTEYTIEDAGKMSFYLDTLEDMIAEIRKKL